MLEPMDFILDESLLGRQIAVYYKTSHGVAAIGGRLRAYTDYELVLDGDDSNYDKSVYKDIACINGCIAYVDRPAWTASSLNRRCRPHEKVRSKAVRFFLGWRSHQNG